MTSEKLLREAEEIRDRVLSERRTLHQSPGTGFDIGETLAAVARELNIRKLTSARVHLAAGLPLTWVSEQKDSFKAYLLQNESADFVFRGVDYHVEFAGADIFPQGFSAVADKLREFKGINMLCDIGNGTMNVMYMLLRSLDCADDAGISDVKKEIAVLENGLKKLAEQEAKYSAELNDALKQYAELKEQAAGMDAAELMDTRIAVREDKERSAVDRIKAAYGEKYDPMLMYDSKRDVANLLNEEREMRSVREFLRQRQQQQAQQKQPKKKSRDSWER